MIYILSLKWYAPHDQQGILNDVYFSGISAIYVCKGILVYKCYTNLRKLMVKKYI